MVRASPARGGCAAAGRGTRGSLTDAQLRRPRARDPQAAAAGALPRRASRLARGRHAGVLRRALGARSGAAPDRAGGRGRAAAARERALRARRAVGRSRRGRSRVGRGRRARVRRPGHPDHRTRARDAASAAHGLRAGRDLQPVGRGQGGPLMWLAALAALALAPQGAEPWKYVVPPDGDPLRRPQLCALPLSAEKPVELKLGVEFRGEWQRYGSLRFGDPDSTRVAVVLDHLSATEIDLYVDVGRDLEIGPRDRVAGEGPAHEIALAVATRDAEGRDVLVPRLIAVELGASGAILSTATLGWLEGEVELGGKTVRALRRDGDSNGFFGDAQDQLWLDRDGSGDFAPLRELFVVQPNLALDGERFALRSDRLGGSLRFERLEGSGKLRLELPGANGAPREDLVDLQALLV